MKPLISVIVPIYKVEKYLAICVDSLLRQSYGNLEVILVDDGSPDECPAICDKYQNKDNRIKVIHKKNGGLSDARNVGLDIAQGEYVAFVDSDDFVDEDYIYKLYNALQQNRTSIAVCGIQIIDESNKVTDQICVTQDKKQELYTGKEIIKKDFLPSSLYALNVQLEDESNIKGSSPLLVLMNTIERAPAITNIDEFKDIILQFINQKV